MAAAMVVNPTLFTFKLGCSGTRNSLFNPKYGTNFTHPPGFRRTGGF